MLAVTASAVSLRESLCLMPGQFLCRLSVFSAQASGMSGMAQGSAVPLETSSGPLAVVPWAASFSRPSSTAQSVRLLARYREACSLPRCELLREGVEPVAVQFGPIVVSKDDGTGGTYGPYSE